MVITGHKPRLIAFLVLVTLPALAAARLTLDARTAFRNQANVESEHNGRPGATHDHRLCVLLIHAPWSPGEPAAVATVPCQSQHDPLGQARGLPGHHAIQLQQARAPPRIA
ncbi:MAG: hypothetical protein PVI01_09080 [Gemmatimonadales bacterium]|jgi:hypothetical protein